MCERVPSFSSSERARNSGEGRQRASAARTSSGMGISRWPLISCSMRGMGNSGARSSGFTGWSVPGWSTGAGGEGRSGMMLYQWRGICSSDSTYFSGMIGPPE
jgi:hypothetical protein